MSLVETTILDKTGKLTMPKNLERDLRGIEENYLLFILEDLLKTVRTRRTHCSVVNVNIFDTVEKYPVEVIARNEKVMSRGEFVKEVLNLLLTKEVAWIDTDVMGFDWSELHLSEPAQIVSKLGSSPIRKAYVSLRRRDGHNDYLSYTIVD